MQISLWETKSKRGDTNISVTWDKFVQKQPALLTFYFREKLKSTKSSRNSVKEASAGIQVEDLLGFH